MNYELLTVGKVISTVTGQGSSSEERVLNFTELLNRFSRYDWLALQSAVVDFYRDLELIDVEGSTINGGRDDPHKSELFAIDDVPHYFTNVEVALPFINGEFRFNHSPFNHFIDIKKRVRYI